MKGHAERKRRKSEGADQRDGGSGKQKLLRRTCLLYTSYTGGSVVEKPERLKYVLKKDAIYTDDEFQEYVDAILKYYFNMMEDVYKRQK